MTAIEMKNLGTGTSVEAKESEPLNDTTGTPYEIKIADQEEQNVETGIMSRLQPILDCLTCYNPWVKKKLFQTITFGISLWMLGAF